MIRVTLAVLAVLLFGACAAPTEQPPPAPSTTTVTSTALSTAPTTATARGLPRSEPTEVHIPRIAARSSLIPLGLNADNTVEVPPVDRPLQAGWYSYAPTPGELGPSIILGHVDGNREPGIFYRLHELVAGDEVFVSRVDGSTAGFVVRRVDQVPKDQFPTESVYGETDEPELRLITCGGSFDQAARSYRDNIIVYATLN